MSRYLVLITILALYILQCQGQDMTFSMEPQSMPMSSNETTNGKPMTLNCRAPITWIVTLIELSRVLRTSSSKQIIARGAIGVANDEVEAGSGISGITAEGSVGGKSATVRFSAAKCSDRGMYTCKIIYNTLTSNGQGEKSENFTVNVLPEQIKLTADPNYSTYKVGDELTLSCNGVVGTTDDGTEVAWVWEYQDEFNAFWREVDSGTVEAGESSNLACHENQISKLILTNLTLEDSGRTYRCWVRRGGIAYEQFADSFEIQSVTESGSLPSNPGSTTGAQKANVGLIVGLVIGILIVIIVVIVIVVFVMRRKRNNQGKNYGAGEDNKPKDEAVPPYTVDPNNPAVTYSQPNRFKNNSADRNNDRSDRPPRGRGHSNQAMDDDLPEKKVNYDPQPARYENQGRYNRGYDRRSPHPDNDHYSSDGDANTSRYSVGDGDPTIGTAI